ncbi:hypothetical protein [Escherichia sp. WS1118]|uniref:hypothetical protein n=1 Tax=Escherichia TaxID=561 RepID=UPI001496071B|nr:hypothetical protein [Escherichia coli]ELP2970345.1 hypothetical protein [Escherichia coli O105]EFG2812057.1 hypothetical protein [Escherichia coli]EFH4703164.1 hypothetical protein [Escherichia coli]EFH7517899.1 hypothetical protein [Escherichia coli]
MDETTDKEKVGNLPASIYCGIPSHSGFVATHNYLQRNKEKMKIQAVWYKEIHQTSNTPYMCPPPRYAAPLPFADIFYPSIFSQDMHVRDEECHTTIAL